MARPVVGVVKLRSGDSSGNGTGCAGRGYSTASCSRLVGLMAVATGSSGGVTMLHLSVVGAGRPASAGPQIRWVRQHPSVVSPAHT